MGSEDHVVGDNAQPSPSPNRADDKLLGEVYDQLRAIARRRLAQESPGHTLQATALVNEAYLKLREHASLKEMDEARFMLAAAQAMRRILVDHARTRDRVKRGGGEAKRVLTDVAELALDQDPDQILALDDAIHRLEQEDAQCAAVVKLRFFTGLSVPETAKALGISERTVKRDWQYARAWLFKTLQ